MKAFNCNAKPRKRASSIRTYSLTTHLREHTTAAKFSPKTADADAEFESADDAADGAGRWRQ